jgi:DNA segregation ATPase FtsK/SpoIIIE, S-DNA-T family
MLNRSACSFSGHHKNPAGGFGLLVLAVVVLAVYLVCRVVAAAVSLVEAWWWVVALASGAVAAAVVVLLLAVRPKWLRHLPRALWAGLRWHSLSRNLGFAYPDRQRRGKTRRPRAVIYPSAHGVTARVRTVPGVGRKEIDLDSEHIANAWRCQRVSVIQPGPGRVRITGHARDPLLQQFGFADAPSGAYAGRDLTRLYTGRDEHGVHRYLQVKNNTAVTVAGQPGSGKSVAINGLLLQWAPSPACQFGTADGKSPVDGGDYEVWRPRAWRTCSDSREDVADMLSDACAVMRARLGCVAEVTGSRNAWHRGPTVDFPLFGIVLDEAQRYLDVTVARRDKELEKLILQIQAMTGDLVRQGRSVLMFLVLATQRATVDSIPGQIRDNAALSLALSQKTMDGAVAALGSQIRDYPGFSPVGLQGPEFAGCAVATMRTGQDPFTRLRFPDITDADLQACAAVTADLRKDPGALLPVTVPDSPAGLTVPAITGR